MFKRLSNIVLSFVVVALLCDISYALKLPGGFGKKKGAKAAVTAVAYNLTAPEYDPALAAYGVIGAYDLGIAGAPVCLAVMEAQIKFALANKAASKAMGYLTDAHGNKETKAQLEALQKQIDKENDVEKKRTLMQEKDDKQREIFDGISETDEISKEQAELYTKASLTVAGSWFILSSAVKDMIELPKKIKDGIDECKDAIKGAKSGGLSGLKAIGGITANLKAITAAAKIPGQFVDAVKTQKELFGKIGKVLKKNKYESPSIEEASEKSQSVDF